jgi:hypothetical protein
MIIVAYRKAVVKTGAKGGNGQRAVDIFARLIYNIGSRRRRVSMTQAERMEKIKELNQKHKRDPEFVRRMEYVRNHNFSVTMTDDPQGYIVKVTKKDEK